MSTIGLSRHEAVSVLTIDRPQVRNAIDLPTMRALSQQVVAASRDVSVRVIVITGAGDRAFSAGGDIAEMTAHAGLACDQAMMTWYETLRCIEECDKPVIAAINGFALGGGTELAMACHIRTASASACLGQPEIALDHLPGAGGTQRLPRLVALGLAYEFLLTGDRIPAEAALRMGLVNHVWPDDELLPRTLELAARIAQRSPIAIKLTLEAIRLGLQGSLDAGLRIERALASLVLESSEARRGLEAFLNKRSQRN